MISRTALVLEDDELLGDTLAEALAGRGFVSTCCHMLQQARLCLCREKTPFQPDLLVLDVLLPDGTASTCCTRSPVTLLSKPWSQSAARLSPCNPSSLPNWESRASSPSSRSSRG